MKFKGWTIHITGNTVEADKGGESLQVTPRNGKDALKLVKAKIRRNEKVDKH